MSGFEGIEFVAPIPEDRYEDVIVHLRENFFADEPLNKALQICQPGDSNADLEEFSLSTLKDGYSIMAFDTETGEVVGVALNGTQSPSDHQAIEEKIEELGNFNLQRIFRLLHFANKGIDLYSKYGVDKLFECRILSVDFRFRGRGLAKELMRRSEEVAKEAGYKVFKEDATGLYSQQIAEALGHETVFELEYATYTSGGIGEEVFKTSPPHKFLKIMAKVLQ